MTDGGGDGVPSLDDVSSEQTDEAEDAKAELQGEDVVLLVAGTIGVLLPKSPTISPVRGFTVTRAHCEDTVE